MSAELRIQVWAMKSQSGKLRYQTSQYITDLLDDSMKSSGWILVDEFDWDGLIEDDEAEVKAKLGIFDEEFNQKIASIA